MHGLVAQDSRSCSMVTQHLPAAAAQLRLKAQTPETPITAKGSWRPTGWCSQLAVVIAITALPNANPTRDAIPRTRYCTVNSVVRLGTDCRVAGHGGTWMRRRWTYYFGRQSHLHGSVGGGWPGS